MITLPLASTLSTCGSIFPVGERCSAWVVVCSGAANGSQSSPEGLEAFGSEGDDGVVLVDWDVEEADGPDSGAGRTSDS
jgi:hypothetical protein